MKNAIIISRYSGLQNERFFEDFCYQLMVVKKSIEDKDIDIIPNSVDIIYEHAFNRLNVNENILAEKAIKETKINSDNLLICIDRGITEDMIEIIEEALYKNTDVKIIAYTLMPKGTIIQKIVESINEEDLDERTRYEALVNVCKKIETRNRMVYSTSGDLTNYRLTFKQETLDAEHSTILSLAASLENKIKRDFINSKDKMAENPFDILNDIRKKAKESIQFSKII